MWIDGCRVPIPAARADRDPGDMGAKDLLGRHGEDAAALLLVREGLTLVDRNWRCGEGELDIVALDGMELVVVEVKTRSSELYGHPLEAVDGPKRRRLLRLAAAWAREHPDHVRGRRLRVDAIAVTGRSPETFVLEHLRDVQ